MASQASARIQASARLGASHAGMRSWIRSDTPLLSPVITVKVPSLSLLRSPLAAR